MLSLADEFGSNESLDIPEFQNFLKNSALCELNLKPSADGTVRLTSNFSAYSQLHILVVDHDSVAQK